MKAYVHARHTCYVTTRSPPSLARIERHVNVEHHVSTEAASRCLLWNGRTGRAYQQARQWRRPPLLLAGHRHAVLFMLLSHLQPASTPSARVQQCHGYTLPTSLPARHTATPVRHATPDGCTRHATVTPLRERERSFICSSCSSLHLPPPIPTCQNKEPQEQNNIRQRTPTVLFQPGMLACHAVVGARRQFIPLTSVFFSTAVEEWLEQIEGYRLGNIGAARFARVVALRRMVVVVGNSNETEMHV